MKATLKPRRFWLPGIAVPLAFFLQWLDIAASQRAGPAFHGIIGAFRLLNEAIHLPAYVAWRSVGFWNRVFSEQELLSLSNCVFLAFVALWWYLLGLEMDFRLLQRAAERSVILRWAWFLAGAVFQFLAVYLVLLMARELLKVISDSLWSVTILWLLSIPVVVWLEFFSLRFLFAARNARRLVPQVSAHSL